MQIYKVFFTNKKSKFTIKKYDFFGKNCNYLRVKKS
jgi:hypothetical protein